MQSKLAERELKPARSATPALKGSSLRQWLDELGNGWQVVDEHHLEKDFKFKNFVQALEFANRVGELAEKVDHHPEICLGWGHARIKLWTHFIGGLHDADFVFAAKMDQLAT